MKIYIYSIISLLTFFLTPLCQSELLDKIIAVIDDKVFTLSEVQRIQGNFQARKNVSPQIYVEEKTSQKDIVSILIKSHLIAQKMNELGYKITDDQVEEHIRSTEQRLGLNREALLKFLQENNLSFHEYFEIIRSTIEFNIFRSRVIIPLISVSDQQVKNAYFNKNLTNKTLAFTYSIESYSLPTDKINSAMLKKMPQVMKQFKSSGILPEDFKNVQTNDLGNVTEEGLDKELSELLKQTDEGSFSQPILKNGQYQVFFVKKKDLVESELFMSSKEQIKTEIYDKESDNIAEDWLEREKEKHFIKYSL